MYLKEVYIDVTGGSDDINIGIKMDGVKHHTKDNKVANNTDK